MPVTKYLWDNKQYNSSHVISMRKEENSSPLHRVKAKITSAWRRALVGLPRNEVQVENLSPAQTSGKSTSFNGTCILWQEGEKSPILLPDLHRKHPVWKFLNSWFGSDAEKGNLGTYHQLLFLCLQHLWIQSDLSFEARNRICTRLN